jgi:plastocyanin
MEKRETFVVGMVVGALLLGAGYLAGRSSASPRRHADAAAADEHPPPPAPRRPRPKPAKPASTVIVGITASSAQPPAGTIIEAGESLQVHAGADESSPVIGTIAPATRVRVLQSRGDGWSVVSRTADEGFAWGWVAWARRAPAPRSGPAATGLLGTASIRGAVRFTGHPPVMAVPKKRRSAEVCKDKEVPYNAVVVHGDKLEGVFVRLAEGAVKGDYKAPAQHAVIDQVDCMYTPRIQGVVAGQTLEIRNGDATLHNVHTYQGAQEWFNKPQIKGSAPIDQEMPGEPKIVKFTCDVHPWMRAFVVVSSHPFFAATGADGTFAIEHVPAGRYPVEAWHPHYGLKRASVDVAEGGAAKIDFAYDGTEPEPAENRDELKDLF